MELKERIEKLKIGSGDCPPGVSPGNFAKLLHSVRKDKTISDVSTSLLSLVCDIKLLGMKLRRWPMSDFAHYQAWVKIREIGDIIATINSEPPACSPRIPGCEGESPTVPLLSVGETVGSGLPKKEEGLLVATLVKSSTRLLGDGEKEIGGAFCYFGFDGGIWKAAQDAAMCVAGKEIVDLLNLKLIK